VTERAAQADEKDGGAGDALNIDRTVEGDRQSWLEVEAVEGVDDRDVLAVRRALVAVGERHVHAQAGILVLVRHREAIARKRPTLRCTQIKSGMYHASLPPRCCGPCDYQYKENHPDGSSAASHRGLTADYPWVEASSAEKSLHPVFLVQQARRCCRPDRPWRARTAMKRAGKRNNFGRQVYRWQRLRKNRFPSCSGTGQKATPRPSTMQPPLSTKSFAGSRSATFAKSVPITRFNVRRWFMKCICAWPKTDEFFGRVELISMRSQRK